jgi:hypothetical protein
MKQAMPMHLPYLILREGTSMKRLFLLLATVALAAVATPAMSADVGVSISIGQPGFYGQIDIGQVARPQVIYTRPMVIERVPRDVVYEPVYLRVPPGHSRNWRKHCGRYNACGRPVYFVRDDWYNRVYVPHYRSHYRDGYRDNDKHERNWRDDDRNDRRYNDRYRDDNDRNDRNRGRDRRDN